MRNYILLTTVLIAFTLLSCEVYDSEPPEVSIKYPAGGVTVSGTVLIEVIAEDDIEMDHVDVFIDGEVTTLIDDSNPYIIAWNTLTLSDGEHVLVARATDQNENKTDSESVRVTVSNN